MASIFNVLRLFAFSVNANEPQRRSGPAALIALSRILDNLLIQIRLFVFGGIARAKKSMKSISKHGWLPWDGLIEMAISLIECHLVANNASRMALISALSPIEESFTYVAYSFCDKEQLVEKDSDGRE